MTTPAKPKSSGKNIISLILMLAGCIVAAFALEEILVPAKIMDGGMVGISMIISQLTGWPLGVLTVLLNMPLVWIGSRKLDRSFLFKTVAAMLVFSGALSLFGRLHIHVTDDKLLATVFGGLILGLGVGLVIQNGGCLDGTEAVAMVISKKVNLSVGQIVLGFNIVIYLTAGALFGLDRALYSLLTYFIVSKVVDFVSTGMLQGKAIMIITDHGKEIAEDIYNTLGRTVTLMEGSGLISGEKVVLYCVITRIELSTMRKIIENDDYSAFMTVSDVSEIVGKHIKSHSAKIRTEDSE
ncbi:MAG: YitT family protein [Ruminococcus sp.]|nr:YitT family protein [Ruminococcus sp.]